MNVDFVMELDSCIQELSEKKECVLIGIDGQCASGKTTLAEALLRRYRCNLFHMDEFFLRPEQRTKERYEEIGGNVDYERFREEVILPLKKGEAFSYRPYDCHSLSLKPPVRICPKSLNIIEGTYALHPYYEDVYDLSVCMLVGNDLQRERIMQRNSETYKKFFEIWIPLERKYLTMLTEMQKIDMMLQAEDMIEEGT